MDTGDGAQVGKYHTGQDSASWLEQKDPMSQSAVFQSGEDTDRELDCMLDLPAPRKPMNSPEEVHELSLLCLMTALWKKLN